jgi:hypothetical protein
MLSVWPNREEFSARADARLILPRLVSASAAGCANLTELQMT